MKTIIAFGLGIILGTMLFSGILSSTQKAHACDPGSSDWGDCMEKQYQENRQSDALEEMARIQKQQQQMLQMQPNRNPC